MKTKGKITAVSSPKEYKGKLQIGFVVDEKWYNIKGEQNDLEQFLAQKIKKGNVVEFEHEKGIVDDVEVLEEASLQEQSSWQDEIVTFKELLKRAHIDGLKGINTSNISFDFEKKTAFFKAIVTGKKGTFEAHGDTTDANVTNELIKPHFIRLAETRAISRALRFYLGDVDFDEMPGSKPVEVQSEKIEDK